MPTDAARLNDAPYPKRHEHQCGTARGDHNDTAKQVRMSTLFTTSPDGTRIAYERCGAGPALVLLHGGGNSRQMWHEAGYVERLQGNFTVIPVDLRGHGESDQPTEPADYVIDKMLQDVLAVADACEAERFIIWGFSFGSRIGRYVASHSARVARIVLMGATLGVGISNEFRQYFAEFCAHWPPILQAQRAGVLDLDSLSQDDRELLQHTNVAAQIAWGRAMLDWPAVEPIDFLCPALWVVGSEDRMAMISARTYEPSLPGSKVQLLIVEGLNHGQVFAEIDKVFATILAFTQS
jgi:pimeloyl-ACP methyl ester carboxylesterase